MGNSKSSAGNLVSLVVWLGYNLPVMKAVGRALRRIPPTPTYAVNRALGRWTDPGPMSAFATRDPIHIVHSTLRINPNMFMFMFRTLQRVLSYVAVRTQTHAISASPNAR